MAKDNPKKTCALCHEERTLSQFLFIVLRGIKRHGTVCAICRGKKPQDDSNDAQPPSLSQRQAALVFFVNEEDSGGWDPEDRAKQKKHHQSLDSKTLAKRLKNAQKQKKKRRQAKKKQNHQQQQRELENTDTHEPSEHDKDSRDTIKTRKNQAFGVSQQPYNFPQKQHAAAQESMPKKEAAHKTQSKKAITSDNAAPSEQTDKEKVHRQDKEHKANQPAQREAKQQEQKKQITKDKTSKPSTRHLATNPSQSMDPKQMRDDGVLGTMYRNKATVGPTLTFAKWLSQHNNPHSQPKNRNDNEMHEELDAMANEQKQVRSTAQSLWQFKPQ